MEAALVTGAAAGIGRAIAAALADAGWTPLLIDRDPRVEEVAAALGGHGAVADVADPGIAGVVSSLEERGGPISAAVSNAAIVDQIHPALGFPADGWERELAVNLSGAFRVVQAAARGMAERRRGRIVVISSGAAESGLPGQVAYSASKAGLLGAVRTMAVELGGAGVTVNAVLPGLIATEKVQAMPESIRARMVSRTALGRAGTPEEVAALVAWLCSDAAGYVTGTCISIDGGGSLNTLSLAGG